jgi:hypothetical protein
MPDTPLLIHIGYHKTATTWMQTRLFQPEHAFRMLADHDEIFARVVKPHGLWFDPGAMRTLIAERCEGLPEGHTAVVSSELLSGHPFYGGHMSDTYAHRLKAIAPDARILISIREQLKILPSVYMQYLLRGGTLPYARFFAGTDVPGFFGFQPEHFEYDRLVTLYQGLFGVNNVHVLTQESLQQDIDATCATLSRFAGNTGFAGLNETARTARGVSYPEYGVPILRRINHLRRSPITPYPALPLDPSPDTLYRAAGYVLRRAPFSTLFKNKKPVSAHVERHYKGHYATSNKRLAEIVAHPIDLSRYEMPHA